MSLRLRLTLWYTGILAATLLVVSVVVYFVLVFALNQQVNQLLSVRERQYSQALLLAGVNTRGAFFREQIANFNPDVYAQLVTTDGQSVSHTSNLPPNWPVDKAVINRVVQTGRMVPQTYRSEDLTVRINNFPLDFQGQIIGVVQLGRDVTQMEASLTFLRQVLVVAGIAGIVVAFGAGWVLARQALKPIERIAETAHDIGTSRDFSRRVDYSGPQDELGRLTATFNDMLAQIQTAYRQIEDALAAQRRFVADASHELRTPLTTIRGNIGLLSGNRDVTSQDRREALEDMASEAERMSRLVSNLLVLARADAGLHFEKQNVRLDDIVQDVYRQARVLSNGVSLSMAQTQPASVRGNPDYLKQLLLILVENALKNTPNGGEVELSEMPQDGWVKLSVRDTGKGISPDALPHIFDRFYQADQARTGGGTGLGLAIAKWIVDEHGGRIQVDSRLSKGTTFTVLLPTAGEAGPHTHDTYRLPAQARSEK